MTLVGIPHLAQRVQNTGKAKEPNSRRGWEFADGAIVEAMNAAGWREYIHCPSLLLHLGTRQSSMGSRNAAPAATFRGEDFDALELLKC
jgi:hypothetical protein